MRRHIFYFIRHGQSLFNERKIRQDSHGQLSDRGVEQAHITGERLHEEAIKHGKINVILCSPYDRTKETAAIINEHLKVKKPIEYSPLLAERRNPSQIIGKSTDDPEIKKIVDLMDHTYHSDDYRFSDEENFLDLKARAKECLKYLEKRSEKKIVVVTHGIFLKMLIAYISIGDSLTAKDYNKISFLNPSNNASVTVAEYVNGFFAPPKEKRWTLLVWDDHYDIKGRDTII